ncbi:hypothetical protein AB0M46_34900 [Dactylosporangium sp. NPDC051485]|uniref:hypothetical protein n=1 Tax=Dactylosporangium sp. NPDC051485 TaxID=3154846 RepID=UPI0034369BEC
MSAYDRWTVRTSARNGGDLPRPGVSGDSSRSGAPSRLVEYSRAGESGADVL